MPFKFSDACRGGGFHGIVGLTGGLASGKSSALHFLRTLGGVGVDADALGHAAYAREGGRAYAPLLARFGPSILRADGEVDRPALGALVFTSPDARAAVQDIVWPAVRASAVDAFLEEARLLGEARPGEVRVGVLEAALLLEAGWGEAVDEVWLLVPGLEEEDATREAVRRAVARSGGMSEEGARSRLAAQMAHTHRLAHPAVRVVVDTSGPPSATHVVLEREWGALRTRLLLTQREGGVGGVGGVGGRGEA